MRIFNWVHRRFIPKDGLSNPRLNLRKDEEEEVRILNNTEAADTKARLDQENKDKAYHGCWNNGAASGILSIGTFGLLKDELSFMINNNNTHTNYIEAAAHKQYFGFLDKEIYPPADDDKWEEDDRVDIDVEEEEENDEDVEGEWNPLLYDGKKGSMMMKYYSSSCEEEEEDDDDQDQDQDREEVVKMVNKKKKERITLADLFSAESVGDDDDDDKQGRRQRQRHQLCSSKVENPNKKKLVHELAAAEATTTSAQKNRGLLFPSKNHISVAKQDSRPIRKLHGLMKRMLKRKIHPDIEVAATGIPSKPVSLFQIDHQVSCGDIYKRQTTKWESAVTTTTATSSLFNSK